MPPLVLKALNKATFQLNAALGDAAGLLANDFFDGADEPANRKRRSRYPVNMLCIYPNTQSTVHG